MKTEQKQQKLVSNQVLAFSLDSIEVPIFSEKMISGKKWIYWGDKNQMPYYLYDLFTKSALMQSIIYTTINFILGNEIKSTIVPNNDEYLEDIVRNLALDYMLYGGFAIQVMYNKMGQIHSLNWLDMRKVRTDEEHTMIYYSKEFNERKSSPAVLEFPVWKSGEEYRNTSAVYLYTGGKRTVYPMPRYSGSIKAIETSIRIDNFHLNAIKNNFSNNTIISFNNGIPSDDVKKEIEKKIKEKFTGDDNAGRFLLTFNDSKENGVEVFKLDDDQFDKKYEALKTSTILSIFTGFSAPQQLFGYALTGNVFNKEEYQDAFNLYQRLQVLPIQNLFKRVFESIYGLENVLDFIPFELTEEKNDENIEETEPTKINPDVNE